MARTFEEHAAEALDELYQGALFLRGGCAAGAERLVVRALTHAFEQHSVVTRAEPVDRWLTRTLALTYLKRDGGDGPLGPRPSDSGSTALRTFDDVDPNRLHLAAAALPPMARALIWLVVFQRWCPRDAAGALAVEPARVERALSYRDTLVAALDADSAPTRRALPRSR